MTVEPADLVVTDLHKAFGDQPVLRGVELTVPAGSLTAVLGASGSGKTTLLRIIAGFERPDRGSLTVGGTVLDDDRHHVRPQNRRIGYVAQEGSLFPHLTVEANVGFGLPRPARRGSRVSDLIDAVGLTGLGERYPHQLSGGQQQRVALARSLAVGSEIVLLDEPFNTLDANLRASIRADVHSILREAGTTGVLVTHLQDEALSKADMVAVNRSGVIVQFAPPADLYEHPVDADLASFVGDANLIDGETDGDFVDTPFGRLAVRGASSAGHRGRVTVMIRPEQVDVNGGQNGAGVPGRVLSAHYLSRLGNCA
jgi:iron(III) transport system ATP-binding protein